MSNSHLAMTGNTWMVWKRQRRCSEFKTKPVNVSVLCLGNPKENVGTSEPHHPTHLEQEVRAMRQEISELKELLKAVHQR